MAVVDYVYNGRTLDPNNPQDAELIAAIDAAPFRGIPDEPQAVRDIHNRETREEHERKASIVEVLCEKVRPGDKGSLIVALAAIKALNGDPERWHEEVDACLLRYIGDATVEEIIDSMTLWFA